jgi:hypothetical protein
VRVDPRKDALDVLVDQSQRLFEIYDARRSSAEGKAAGILTAATAIAALTVTAASLVKHVNVELAVGLVGFLVLSIACAIYAGAAAGLRHREARVNLASSGPAADQELPVDGARQPLLSTESADYARAARAVGTKADEMLAECRDDASVAIVVRARALELWLERQADAHHLAQRKDRAVGLAGIMLGFALVCGAAMVIVILAHSG